MAEPRRCAVLGAPIQHSLSPVLHTAAYRHLGLDWEYTACEVHEHELAGFVAGLDPSWRGLSLTMPLKRVALDLAGEASALARTVGAANTLLLEPGRVRADNTDVPGMVAAMVSRADLRPTSACVWGGGATAASALAALADLGATTAHLHARDRGRAAGPLQVAAAVGVTVSWYPWAVGAECADTDLVVSTVPAGATDAVAEPLASTGAVGRLLFDVVYEPWPTRLAVGWKKAGGAVASGLDLLVHQAVGQVRLMTGRDVPADVLYAAVS